MKITVDDHAPGAGAGRRAYLEDRARRVLGRMSERLASLAIELRPDELYPGHCRVGMTASLAHDDDVLEVSVQRRLMPDALADAFDALVTRIALHRLRLSEPEDMPAFVRPPAPRVGRRARAS